MESEKGNLLERPMAERHEWVEGAYAFQANRDGVKWRHISAPPLLSWVFGSEDTPTTKELLRVVAERDALAANVTFCDECGRFFDVRSGCEKDIRFDERVRIASFTATKDELKQLAESALAKLTDEEIEALKASAGGHLRNLGKSAARLLTRDQGS